MISEAGSSPHVWGTPGVRGLGSGASRYHPHMCGEHLNLLPSLVFVYGSSPHVWGTPSKCTNNINVFRFIPTCVGNTPLLLPHTIQVTVHPHMCGEHISSRFEYLITDGSSPHVWGTLFYLHSLCVCSRFIPTCVGNTTKSSH